MGAKLTKPGKKEKTGFKINYEVTKTSNEEWDEFVKDREFVVKEVDWEHELEIERREESVVRIVCMSDTHTQTDTLGHTVPEGDIFIHTGDFTNHGKKEEVEKFNDWLGTLPHPHKVVIAGNHEITFDPKSFDNFWAKKKIFGENFDRESPEANTFPNHDQLLTNCTYLQDSGTEILGLKIYGSPWVPGLSHEWGFTLKTEEEKLEKWRLIPEDTNILLTHTPALGIGDLKTPEKRLGCATLLREVVDRVKPSYHIYGHVHAGYGVRRAGGTTFANAATCDYMGSPGHKPLVFDVVNNKEIQ
eukprot:GFUD01014558.1.p1 GENE.GFUD01014558.1~~GFUD01014558.1.p1  ORF type:complete len:302 (+),score=71.37 GFUD01014558.1:95-1000(+)